MHMEFKKTNRDTQWLIFLRETEEKLDEKFRKHNPRYNISLYARINIEAARKNVRKRYIIPGIE